ncbi:MAG: DUF456 domain-containing protein [Gemmatimonadetes bacterium]|nr:DUF456 domain-containing protein [Gemmatimonadota bacterium]
MLDFLLLAAGLVVGLLLVPLGLPGLWLMLALGLAHQLLVDPPTIGWIALGWCLALAIVAEILEFTLSVRYTAKYGGSRRAGWGSLIGGLIGAVMGVPIPLVGSLIGAFLGSFLGALVAEYSVARDRGAAGRAAWGSLLGRVMATVAKTAIGIAIAVILLARA